ncbi:MAG: hypothetical protein IT488_11670 [Gammaproteobacteria bacterium]|nr:hypothetical protein [Gammaproteobacteria bacterium]
MSGAKKAVQKFDRSAAASTEIKDMKRFAKTLTPESAKRFLEQAGIVTKKGNLTSKYR